MTKEKSLLVHDQQVNITRKVTENAIDDLIGKLISFASNSYENRSTIAATIGRALDQYNDALLSSVDRIGFTPLNLTHDNFNLDAPSIEKLENINATQRLILHQVHINTTIKNQIINLTNSASIDNMVDLLKGIVILDDYSNYMAKFPGIEPESFRKFQFLNHYAYLNFSALLYEETIFKLSDYSDKTIKEYMDQLISLIHEFPTDFKEKQQLSTYQDKLIDNFWTAIQNIAKSSNTDQEDLIKKIRTIIPSLLQIENTVENERLLKISINELIEIEKNSSDFKLTGDFFGSYFENCYKNHKGDSSELKASKQQEKAEAKNKIIDYIHYVRNIDNKTNELPQNIKRLSELSVIKSQITQLQIKELLSSCLISEKVNEDLKKIVSRIANIGYDVLTERLPDYSDFIKHNKEKLVQFKKEYHIEGNIDLLVNYIEEQLNIQTMTVRATYYDTLLKTIDQSMWQPYLEINKYINAKVEHAEAILSYPDKSDSEITESDKISIIPSNVFNPLIYKIKHHMPRDIADKLKILTTIKREVDSVSSELSKLDYFIEQENNAPIAIKTGIKNLLECKEKLGVKYQAFEANLLQFSIGKIELALEEQKKYAQQQNRELLNKVIPISLDTKEKLDLAISLKTNTLSEKLIQIKSYLSESKNYSEDFLAQQLSEIKTLIAQLELQALVGKKLYDFSQVKQDIDVLNQYYKNKPDNKLEGIKRFTPASTTIPYNLNETVPNGVTTALFLAPIIRGIFSAYNAVKNTIKTIFKHLGIFYRNIARISTNNRALLNRMDKLNQEISSGNLQNKRELRDEISALRDKVGRFTIQASDIVEQYDALNIKIQTAKNQSLLTTTAEPNALETLLPITNPKQSSQVIPPSPSTFEAASSSLNEHTELLHNILANPNSASAIAEQFCYTATKNSSHENRATKITNSGKQIRNELTKLHASLKALITDPTNIQVKVISSQIRVLEKIQDDLEKIKENHSKVSLLAQGEKVSDEWIKSSDSVDASLDNLEYQLNSYFGTQTSTQRVVHCLKNFTQAQSSPREKAMFVLLKNAVIEVSMNELLSSSAAEIANTALMAVLDSVPSIAASLTDTWGPVREVVAYKNIINASFDGIVKQLHKSTDIKDLEKACQQSASIALTKELSQLATILLGQSQDTEDIAFREKIIKLSESTSNFLLQVYAANQGLQLMLVLVEKQPKLGIVLEKIFLRARDSITDALMHNKTTEEVIAAANKVVYEEVQKALGDQYTPTSTAKKIQHSDAPKQKLEERLRTTIMQTTKELVQLEKRLNQSQEKQDHSLANTIQFKISEKAKSLAQLMEIQNKLTSLSTEEEALNLMAKSYPYGEEQFKIIYHEEKYAPMILRKFELENAFENILSPGLMTQVYNAVNNVCLSISEPTQIAAASTLRDIINTTVESLKQNDCPRDIAFKVIDVTLQGLLTVLNTVDFGNSTNDRKEILQKLIKIAITEAVEANHQQNIDSIDPELLSKHALIKVLKELQNPKLFEKITVNWWRNTQIELFKIGSDAAIHKLQEKKSAIPEAAESFCSATYNHVNNLWLPNPLQMAIKKILKPNTPPSDSPVLKSKPVIKEKSISNECELTVFKNKFTP